MANAAASTLAPASQTFRTAVDADGAGGAGPGIWLAVQINAYTAKP